MSIALISLLVLTVAILAFRLKTQRDTFAGQIKSARQQRDTANTKLKEAIVNSQITIDALSDAFFIVDQDLTIRRFNTRAREIFRNQDLLDRNLPEVLMHPQFSACIKELIDEKKVAKKRLTIPASTHGLGGSSPEGEAAWIIQISPLPEHGDTPLYCLTLRDVSTEHRSDQIRTDFVANASHELRTPLAIINGYLENLVDDDMLEEPTIARRMLTTMRQHGARLTRLVDDMLVVSKLESGEAAALNSEEFDLIECAEDVLERLDPLITSNDTQVLRDYAAEEIIINGDRFYWTQVMFNLIENAIKQNPSRQLTITLTIKPLTGDKLLIAISDDGIGIPSSHLPFIFKRFYRVDKHHTQSNIKGTGLGLSIVKRAIEAHNGTIEASSQPGIKTTFSITTPSGLKTSSKKS